jgi:hypothetical protein
MTRRILVSVLAALLFITCSDDSEPAVSPSAIAFETTRIEVSTDTLKPFDLTLRISPNAPINSEVLLTFTPGASTYFSTSVPVVDESITVSIPAQSNEVNLPITINDNEIDLDDVRFEFKIAAVGNGLTTDPLEGRFCEVIIISNKAELRTLPYVENFERCSSGSLDAFPPPGWTEQVVQQNASGTANWRCITSPIDGMSINAFIPGSPDNSSSEVWMITPRIDMLEASSASLQFDIDRRFSPDDPQLEPFDLLISTNFNGNNFESATWQRFEAGYAAIAANDPDLDNIETTSRLSLNDYTGEIINLAFVYRAGSVGTVDATILRVGNVRVE